MASAGAADGLFFDYAAVPGFRDELVDGDGVPRPHWRGFLRSVRELGGPELLRRWDAAQRLIHDNGVTYNVYGDPRGMDRPWQLDAFPLVVASEEWRGLRAGLEQRAVLLDLLLADLHGPQRLLHEGLLPAELVFAHPGFLRPCHGLALPEDRHLHVYAADLARSPDGQWWVLADRTQAPSGAGYALENRIVLARALPEAFREGRIARLAGFFRTLRDTLRRLAPGGRDNPRIALLTPGPYNETYFEHAYLARYLGWTLVEGADLTVRDRTLYLKTLGGLERIDVVLRRVDDAFCDPLSLRADSALGVAGLLQAVRAGNVVVANALGSGLVETPALLAFLPGLCRALLGEALKLPSVATWWCGHRDVLAYVIEHLGELVVKPTFPGTGLEPVFGERLSAAEREALVARLRARPHLYVAQEQVELSTAPVWTGDAVSARHVVLRAYGVAAREGYDVMPGGLTRVATTRDSLVVSMQRGGGSKDTWVPGDGPVPAITLLPPTSAPLELVRGGAELPSRVADNLFWLGRYVERAEGLVRLARVTLLRLDDEASGGGGPARRFAAALARQSGVDALAPEPGEALERVESRVLALVLREEGPRALGATLASVHHLAFTLRDQISLDTWRVLSRLREEMAEARDQDDDEPDTAAVRRLVDRMVMGVAAWSGLAMENMTRGQGWRFADMGRRIERALHTASLLGDVLVPAASDDTPLLEALLEVADSALTYRRRYLAALQPVPVLDLLLTDETNPRSIAFQLVAAAEHVDRLPRRLPAAGPSPEQRIALAALTRVRLADVHELGRLAAGKRLQLAELLGRLAQDLPSLCDAITRSYLSHAEAARRHEAF